MNTPSHAGFEPSLDDSPSAMEDATAGRDDAGSEPSHTVSGDGPVGPARSKAGSRSSARQVRQVGTSSTARPTMPARSAPALRTAGEKGAASRRPAPSVKARSRPPAHPAVTEPEGLPADLSDAGLAVAERVARSLQSLQKVEGEIADLIRQAMALTLQGGSLAGTELARAVREVVLGSLAGMQQTGAELSVAVRGIARGVVLGAADVRADVGAATAEMLRLVMKHAARVGSDVALVARRAMDGVVRAVNEAGYNLGDVGRVALAATFAATRRMGRGMTTAVRAMLMGLSEGLDPLIASLGSSEARKRPVSPGDLATESALGTSVKPHAKHSSPAAEPTRTSSKARAAVQDIEPPLSLANVIAP